MKIEVCMPTSDSGCVLPKTLEHLSQAESHSSIEISTLRVTDDNSSDDTTDILQETVSKNGWNLDLEEVGSTLPAARQSLINRVQTDWFLFLDDDVRISIDYLEKVVSCVAEGIGAVQGRKASKTGNLSESGQIISDIPGSPTDWVRKRSFRGGTHATLIRHNACANIVFPDDLLVWEDEYLRREIESNGYLWIFNHQALFEHENQNRHPPGWTEGYLQAKYDLRPFWHVLLNIPYAVLTGKSPIGYLLMVAGYVSGWIQTE